MTSKAGEVAAGIVAFPVKIDTSMSCSTLADSTFPQLGEFGVNRLTLAAAANFAGSPVLSETRDVVFGITPPTVTIWLWNLVPPSSPAHSWASAWCWLLAAIPRSEPPRKTGAVWPAIWLGIGKASSLSFRVGSPLLGSRITPTSQPLATIIAMWPCAKAWSCLASSPVLSARESLETRLCNSVRPCWDCELLIAPVHLVPDWVAMSPPKSHTNGAAAYQYLPGKYRAEKLGSDPFLAMSVWPTLISWSMLVGGCTPAAANKSVR